MNEVAVPCMFYPCTEPSNKILVYFHANAEDAGLAEDFLRPIKEQLYFHVIAVEYPKYGVYPGTPTEEGICRDAETVYDYLHKHLQIDQQSIFLMGRSMGSGPSTHLASVRQPGGLFLISPFVSIQKVAQGVVGKLFGKMVKDRFDNFEKMARVTCPVQIIHGTQDALVPFKHAEMLIDRATGIKKLETREGMTHRVFNIYHDVINPIYYFLKTHDLNSVPDQLGEINQEAIGNHQVLTKYFKPNSLPTTGIKDSLTQSYYSSSTLQQF
jgi:fermentation-respiration switch protein FrsA (DUF1100 family)